MVVLASLLRAGMGLAYKHGLTVGADRELLMAWTGVCWLAGGAVYSMLMERGQPVIGKTGMYGLCSGLLICGIVYFMAAALQVGEASVVLPIAQLSFVATSLFGIVFLKEAVTGRTIAGLLLAVVCVVCLTLA